MSASSQVEQQQVLAEAIACGIILGVEEAYRDARSGAHHEYVADGPEILSRGEVAELVERAGDVHRLFHELAGVGPLPGELVQLVEDHLQLAGDAGAKCWATSSPPGRSHGPAAPSDMSGAVGRRPRRPR